MELLPGFSLQPRKGSATSQGPPPASVATWPGRALGELEHAHSKLFPLRLKKAALQNDKRNASPTSMELCVIKNRLLTEWRNTTVHVQEVQNWTWEACWLDGLISKH